MQSINRVLRDLWQLKSYMYKLNYCLYFCLLSNVDSITHLAYTVDLVFDKTESKQKSLINTPVSQICTVAKSEKLSQATGQTNFADRMEDCSIGQSAVLCIEYKKQTLKAFVALPASCMPISLIVQWPAIHVYFSLLA